VLLLSGESDKAADKVTQSQEEKTKTKKKRQCDRQNGTGTLSLSLSLRGLIDASLSFYCLLVLLNSRKLYLPLS
jgi:hypothetical protein